MGNVFVDTNKDSIKNGLELNYIGSISIFSSAGVVSDLGGGTYRVDSLPQGSYTVSLRPPLGYIATYPLPPTFVVTVGPSCSVQGALSAACIGGSIINLNFGITDSYSWIQSTGGDMRIDSGFWEEIPLTAAGGAYASLKGTTGTPGLILSGRGTPGFGAGQASQNPYNWVIGNPIDKEIYSDVRSFVPTSYYYTLGVAQNSSLTPIDLGTICIGGVLNCTLPSNLPHGLYGSNNNVDISGPSYTFPLNQNYVFLIQGDLHISTKIFVPKSSTVTFSVSGSITVDKSIGEAPSSTASTIEGFYSADKDFIAQGKSVCPSSPDGRLNIAGSVVVNAALKGGSFINQRDLCNSNQSYPSVSFSERADFLVNAPRLIQQRRITWREVAP